MSPGYSDMLLIHAACTDVLCQHVFYRYYQRSDSKTGSLSEVCRIAPDGEKNIGIVPFPRMPLATALKRFLRRARTEEMCEESEERRRRDKASDFQFYGNMAIYRDAYSSSAWDTESLKGEPTGEGEHLILHVNIGIDGYQPTRSNHARMQSVGPIIALLTNLPLKKRANMSYALLLGITPGESACLTVDNL
jgi:hypothetical protein